MSVGPRPPRPHAGLTPEGNRIREVLSYTRRGSKFTITQAQASAAYAEQWWIPDEALDAPDFALADWFGRSAPLIVEIGAGVGEATAALAATRPDHDILAFEVWHPGAADTLGRVAAAGATNVRVISVDAVWSVEHVLAPGSVGEMWTFFPDPWPKTRHERRRLVGPRFAALVAERLEVGAAWRLATDWAPYAEQMAAVLDAEPRLEGGPTPRWADRPVTRFERRGMDKGNPVADFTYRRRGPA